MKKNKTFSSVHHLFSVMMVVFLASCGGEDSSSNSNPNSTSISQISSLAQDKSSAAETTNIVSADSPEILASYKDYETLVSGNLTKAQLDAVPTVAVKVSRKFNNLKATDFTDPSQGSSSSAVINQNATNSANVNQLIIKYKDQASTTSSNNSATSANTKLNSEVNLNVSAISLAVDSVTKKNQLNLKFEGELQNNAGVFSLDKKIKSTDFAKLAAQMKAADPNIEYIAEDTLLSLSNSKPNSPAAFKSVSSLTSSNKAPSLSSSSAVASVDKPLNQIKSSQVKFANQANLSANVSSIQSQSVIPSDPLFDQQWSLKDSEPYGLQLQTLWPKATGSGVVVAVLDTGYRPHADMAGRILPGYDFISSTKVSNDGNGRDANAIDPGDGYVDSFCGPNSDSQANNSWQGTQVAGIIAANANNGIGITGIAPDAKILPVRVLGRCGGYVSDIADAIVWAAGGAVKGVPVNKTPAKIINLPTVGRNYGVCHPLIQSAIANASLKGAVVVAEQQGYFGNCNLAIQVGYSYQNGLAGLRVGATFDIPFDNILTTRNSGTNYIGFDDWYVLSDKLNVAQASGVIALMFSYRPRLITDQILPYTTYFNQCATNQLDCDFGSIMNPKNIFNQLNATFLRASSDFIGHSSGNGSSGFLLRRKLANGEQFNTVGFITKNKISLPWPQSQTFNNVTEWTGDFNGDGKADVLDVVNDNIVGFSEVSNTGLLTPSVALNFNDNNHKVIQISNESYKGKNLITTSHQTQFTNWYLNNDLSFDYNWSGNFNDNFITSYTDKYGAGNGIYKVPGTNFYNASSDFELRNNEKIIGSAHFFNNYNLQLLVLNTQTRVLSLATVATDVGILGSKYSYVSYLPIINVGKNWEVVHIGDYNGNGQDDFLLLNKVSREMLRTSFGGSSFSTSSVGKLPATYSFEPSTHLAIAK